MHHVTYSKFFFVREGPKGLGSLYGRLGKVFWYTVILAHRCKLCGNRYKHQDYLYVEEPNGRTGSTDIIGNLTTQVEVGALCILQIAVARSEVTDEGRYRRT